jgi:7-cyano-7-deazaguanine synthase
MGTANYVTILASGGIDSTACIHFYKSLGFEIEVMFFDYQQQASQMEEEAIKSITRHYNVPLKITRIAHDASLTTEVKGRNGSFLLTALMQFKRQNGLLCIGIHKGTPYYDCSPNFVNSMQGIFDGYSDGAIKISAPFLKFNKKEIYDYCRNELVPLELTYSCELGKEQPCGICLTCKDLIELYAL